MFNVKTAMDRDDPFVCFFVVVVRLCACVCLFLFFDCVAFELFT